MTSEPRTQDSTAHDTCVPGEGVVTHTCAEMDELLKALESYGDLLRAVELADALLSQLGRVYDGSSQQVIIRAAIQKARGQ